MRKYSISRKKFKNWIEVPVHRNNVNFSDHEKVINVIIA